MQRIQPNLWHTQASIHVSECDNNYPAVYIVRPCLQAVQMKIHRIVKLEDSPL